MKTTRIFHLKVFFFFFFFFFNFLVVKFSTYLNMRVFVMNLMIVCNIDLRHYMLLIMKLHTIIAEKSVNTRLFKVEHISVVFIIGHNFN